MFGLKGILIASLIGLLASAAALAVGYDKGFAAADRSAELQDVRRQLGEARQDRAIAGEAAEAAQEDARRAQAATVAAGERMADYVEELERLAKAGHVDLPCRRSTPADVMRLRPVEDGPNAARPAARK